MLDDALAGFERFGMRWHAAKAAELRRAKFVT
jgi:hypothetical protein